MILESLEKNSVFCRSRDTVFLYGKNYIKM